MKRIQLIVTGEMEVKSLHLSLGNLFPNVEFIAPFLAYGFTSNWVKSISPHQPCTGITSKPVIDKLAAALLSYVEPGRQRSGHVDLVLVLEDLELCNQDQPAIVVEEFGKAVRRQLDSRGFNGDSLRKTEEKLRSRCSFHLFAPMPEAYFFAPSTKSVGTTVWFG